MSMPDTTTYPRSKTRTARAAVDGDESAQRGDERQTSITAHIVRAVSVTMSGAEMDVLVKMLGNVDTYSLNPTEQAIRSEFIGAVESVR